MTLQDGLVAYKTYARAEGKSPKTIRWITSSVGYFADFLGPDQQDISIITANDFRRFIIALQDTTKFSHHPYNKPQQVKLSPQSIETYCRAIRAFFGYLYREGFIDRNPMEKVKMPYERLKSLPNAESCLRPGITLEKLETIANQMSDNQFAERMVNARSSLFQQIAKLANRVA